MTDIVIVRDDGPIRTLRMNRPDKKNALTLAMYEAMSAALESADHSPALRCVVIAGAPGAFCAGNDLADFLQMVENAEGLAAPILRFLHALARAEKPLVAAAAHAAGIVNTVVAPAEVDAEAMKAAREIAALPAQALAASRALLRGTPDEIVARIDEEAAEFKRRLASPEARAAFEAFFKRK